MVCLNLNARAACEILSPLCQFRNLLHSSHYTHALSAYTFHCPLTSSIPCSYIYQFHSNWHNAHRCKRLPPAFSSKGKNRTHLCHSLYFAFSWLRIFINSLCTFCWAFLFCGNFYFFIIF